MNRTGQRNLVNRFAGAAVLIVGLLVGSACTEPKQARTEPAAGQLDNAVSTGAEEAAAKLRRDLDKTERTAAESADRAKADLRRQRQRVLKDFKIESRKLRASLKRLKADLRPDSANAKANR